LKKDVRVRIAKKAVKCFHNQGFGKDHGKKRVYASIARLLQAGSHRPAAEAISVQECDAGARLEKIVLNIGVGEATENAKNLDGAVEDLTKIAGQKPVIRKAKSRFQTLSCAPACDRLQRYLAR
jgi:ribosomal protein L5